MALELEAVMGWLDRVLGREARKAQEARQLAALDRLELQARQLLAQQLELERRAGLQLAEMEAQLEAHPAQPRPQDLLH